MISPLAAVVTCMWLAAACGPLGSRFVGNRVPGGSVTLTVQSHVDRHVDVKTRGDSHKNVVEPLLCTRDHGQLIRR